MTDSISTRLWSGCDSLRWRIWDRTVEIVQSRQPLLELGDTLRYLVRRRSA